jgi:TonB family protein
MLQEQAGHLHGRQMVMLVTIALHALVIAGLMMMKIVPELRPPVIHIQPIDPPLIEPQTEEQRPVLKVDDLNRPEDISKVRIVDPEVVFPVEQPNDAVAPVADSTIASAVATEGPGSGTAVIPDIPSTPLQFSAVRPADDYYPSASQSMQEEGLAIVRVCVTPAGRLDGKPEIQTSSGSPRLDSAALTWVREALRFKPATERGVPIAACKGFRVNFKLR